MLTEVNIETNKTHKRTQSHLLVDVDVTGVDAVSEQVLRAAVTAAQVAVVKQLPAQTHRDAQTERICPE